MNFKARQMKPTPGCSETIKADVVAPLPQRVEPHMDRSRRYRPGPLIIGGFLSLALVGIAGGLLTSKPPLVVQGEVDATQIKLAPKVAGRVKAVHVRKGDKVRRGQLLVSLESQELQAKLAQARTAMRAAGEEHDNGIRSSRVEVICAQSNWWVTAKAVAERAEQNVNRCRALQATQVISLQELRDSERALDVAQSSERAAKASFDLAVAGFHEQDKLAAAANYQQASNTVEELEALVAEFTLTSPIDGQVQDRIVEEGALVRPGFPVVSIVDLQDVWVTFNLREDLLANIRIGSTFRVRVPALGNKQILVKVNSIAPKGDPATWRATKASSDFGLKTFEVRAVPTEATEGLRPGMSVLATCEKYTRRVPQLGPTRDRSRR
jgi:HlyD family secretion protein